MAKTKTFDLIMGYKDDMGNVHLECEVRRLDGNSEEIISDRKLTQNPAKLITALLAYQVVRIGTIIEPSEQVIRSLHTGDRDMILLEVRKLSFGDTMIIENECPNQNCKMKHDIKIDLNDIEIVEWNPSENKFHKGEKGIIEFELPDGYEDKNGDLHKKGVMRLSNGALEENIAPILRENPGKANTAMFASNIVTLGSLKMVDTKVVKNFTRRDREYLAKVVTKSSPGPRFSIAITCPMCLHEYNFVINLTSFFTGGKSEEMDV